MHNAEYEGPLVGDLVGTAGDPWFADRAMADELEAARAAAEASANLAADAFAENCELRVRLDQTEHMLVQVAIAIDERRDARR